MRVDLRAEAAIHLLPLWQLFASLVEPEPAMRLLRLVRAFCPVAEQRLLHVDELAGEADPNGTVVAWWTGDAASAWEPFDFPAHYLDGGCGECSVTTRGSDVLIGVRLEKRTASRRQRFAAWRHLSTSPLPFRFRHFALPGQTQPVLCTATPQAWLAMCSVPTYRRPTWDGAACDNAETSARAGDPLPRGWFQWCTCLLTAAAMATVAPEAATAAWRPS